MTPWEAIGAALEPLAPVRAELVGWAWPCWLDDDGMHMVDPNVISNFVIRLHWHEYVAAAQARLLDRSHAERWWNR